MGRRKSRMRGGTKTTGSREGREKITNAQMLDELTDIVCLVFPHCVDLSLFWGVCFKAEIYVNKSESRLDRLNMFMLF